MARTDDTGRLLETTVHFSNLIEVFAFGVPTELTRFHQWQADMLMRLDTIINLLTPTSRFPTGVKIMFGTPVHK